MTKNELGKALKKLLVTESDVVKISRWALKLYSENYTYLDSTMIEILECLFSIEDDPQFELSNNELNEIADRLIFEGEKEELEPIPEIKNTAEDLGDNWLMCPLCQEAWQFQTKYGMVLCPKCGNKLHNPKFESS
jgi:hypothetical protein